MLLLAIAKVCNRCYMSQIVAGTRKPWVAHVEPLEGMEHLLEELMNKFEVFDESTQETVTVKAPKKLSWAMLKAEADLYRQNKNHAYKIPFRLEFLGVHPCAH